MQHRESDRKAHRAVMPHDLHGHDLYDREIVLCVTYFYALHGQIMG